MLRICLPFFLFASLLLSGCVVTEQDLQMQRDLLEMKRRLGDAERALKELQDDASGGVRAHVETLSRNQADFQAELDGVRVDLQSMQGQTGDQERVNDDMRQDLVLLRDELSLQIVCRLLITNNVLPSSKVAEVPIRKRRSSQPPPKNQRSPPQALQRVKALPSFTSGRSKRFARTGILPAVVT
jgi:hypothetical protein